MPSLASGIGGHGYRREDWVPLQAQVIDRDHGTSYSSGYYDNTGDGDMCCICCYICCSWSEALPCCAFSCIDCWDCCSCCTIGEGGAEGGGCCCCGDGEGTCCDCCGEEGGGCDACDECCECDDCCGGCCGDCKL
jgi:hypothetical protein